MEYVEWTLKSICKVRKALLFLLIFCLLAVFNSSAARAEEGYFEIGRTEDIIYSLYFPSVEDRGDYIVGWIKEIIRHPNNKTNKKIDGKTPHYHMVLLAANRDRKQIQTLSFAVYDKDGQVLISDSRPFNSYSWDDCIPNTVGEAFWYAITESLKAKE